ncbi:MAG TPA: ABC transporter permease [Mycobacteriales bacterium]|jgi:peptide/nickel transport system permease protein
MARILLRRAGESLATLFLASLVVFLGIRAIPGSLANTLAGEQQDPKTIAAIKVQYGLDQNVIVQYWHYLQQMVSGDFGVSATTGIPIGQNIKQALPITVELAGLSILIAAVFGVAVGVLAAVRRGRPSGWVSNVLALLGMSIPHFWFGVVMILVFAIAIPVLPSSGFVPLTTSIGGNLQSMILPALVLGTGLAAVLMRQTRSSMLESLDSDYVRTARAKGMPARTVIFVHALRNSLITVTTIAGLQLGGLISGAVIVEQVFVLPGIGKLTVDSVFARDYPTVEAVALIIALGYVVVNLLVDVVYTLIDPRIRLRGATA